jgi:hypothetical protein
VKLKNPTIRSFLVFVGIHFLFGFIVLQAQLNFTAGELSLGVTEGGRLSGLFNSKTKINYLAPDIEAPILSVVREGNRYLPSTASFNSVNKSLLLSYSEIGTTIEILIVSRETHLVLELIRATPEEKIDAVIWGPFPTTIGKTIGEIIGVVRDDQVALGLQVLNIETLGGDYPNNEGSTWARGIAALSEPYGSRFQAYSLNRSKDRRVDAWGGVYKNMPVAALSDSGVVGSKIALFTCAENETLDRLEQIELAEGLPHPTIDGVWFKKSKVYGKSYMISSFGEADIDEMIGYAKRSGLISLYHEGPFASWGHFVLNPEQFPNGREGLKQCADKAHAAGLYLGVHTLTNFINTNDPYVTPIPDDRLSLTGSSVLTDAITADQTTIPVAAPEYFNQVESNTLHAIKIGSEIIRYRTVTNTAPYTLLDCTRGAYGTAKSEHKAGDKVGKLFDHPYQVFFPNLEMQREIAKNIADLMNETGVDHLDLDGHEGALASGQGDYALELFARDVYEQVQHDLLIGTSISKTFYWHIGSYYNWGEPWYGGFKESMQQYRIDNQGLFDRNFMPHMLGWYLLTENTTLPEMEWMLARAAGYNAGFAMVARPKALRNNPITNQLLDAIREWEKARNGGAFSNQIQDLLKDPKREFHLETISEGQWRLDQFATSAVYIHEQTELQPGQPTYSTWDVDFPWTPQPLQFRLEVEGTAGTVSNARLNLDNYLDINLPVELQAGESLVCDGTNIVRVYDAKGKPRHTLTLEQNPPNMQQGGHQLLVDADFSSDSDLKIHFQIKGLAQSTYISLEMK